MTQHSPAGADVIIYHFDGTRSERVLWLMEELDAPYRLAFDPTDQAAAMAAMRSAHPMSMAPSITVGGQAMVESGAILEYLAQTYGAGRLTVAPGKAGYLDYLQWLHFAEGSAAPRIINDYVSRSIPDVGALSPIAGGQIGGAGRILSFVDQTLSQRPYFAGADFTAADINMHFPMKLARMWGVDLTLYPHMAAWLERVEARPGYKRAMAKGSPNGVASHSSRFQPLLAPTGKAA